MVQLLSHPNQREALGGALFPRLAGREKHARNIYAHSEEECEKLLAGLSVGMKAEIAIEKERLKIASRAG